MRAHASAGLVGCAMRLGAGAPPLQLHRRLLSSDNKKTSSILSNIGQNIGSRFKKIVGEKTLERTMAKVEKKEDISMQEAARQATQEQKMEDAWQAHLEVILRHEKYEMDELGEHCKWMLTQAEPKGMMQRMQFQVDKMRGGTDSQAIEARKAEANAMLAVIGQMSAPERRKPLLLVKRPARMRIAAALGHEDDEWVKKTLHQYEEFLVTWGWLKKESRMGRPMPRDENEFAWRARQKPTRLMHRVQLERNKKVYTKGEQNRLGKGWSLNPYEYPQRRNRRAAERRRTR